MEKLEKNLFIAAIENVQIEEHNTWKYSRPLKLGMISTAQLPPKRSAQCYAVGKGNTVHKSNPGLYSRSWNTKRPNLDDIVYPELAVVKL